MKITKFKNFITEKIHDTPEAYVSTVLNKLRNKIVNIFEADNDDDVSLSDFNVNLESAEVSKYSKLYDSLTVKFSDSEFAYTLIILIDIKQAVPKSADEDFGIDDIKNCYVKFKKYDDNFDLIGNIDKNVEITKIDKEFIIDLKLEIDETFGLDEDDFKIET